MSFHNSPNDMARNLIGYIDCDKQVQAEVAAHFMKPPHLSTIRALRASKRHQAKENKLWRDKGHEQGLVQADEKHRRAMAEGSAMLAERVNIARGWLV